MRARALVAASCAASIVACTDDLNAPYNYQQTTGSESGGDPLAIDCGELGRAAVGASYSRAIGASGGVPPYRFDAGGTAPPGLGLDQGGTLAGTPITAGVSTITVTVTDAEDATASGSCELEVAPQLAVVPLALDTSPYCLTDGDTLLAHVLEGTGDGTPVVCDTPGGNGNGELPSGVSIDADTCAVVGTTNDTRLGTWAFVVRGTQSGVEVFVPYCVTQPTPAAGTFDIVMDHSGATGQTLIPVMRTFNPDGSLMIGGGNDPLFTITDEDACGDNACSYGYNYFINASPFDADTVSLEPSELVRDDADVPIGFQHHFAIGGPVVPDVFKTRPWVVNLALDYCISDTMADCDGAAIAANANGFLELSVIMVPMPP